MRFGGGLMGASSADAVHSHQAPRMVAVLEQLWCLSLVVEPTSPFLHCFSLGADWPLNLVVALHQSTDDVQTRPLRPADGEAEQRSASRAVLVALARSARSLCLLMNASDLLPLADPTKRLCREAVLLRRRYAVMQEAARARRR